MRVPILVNVRKEDYAFSFVPNMDLKMIKRKWDSKICLQKVMIQVLITAFNICRSGFAKKDEDTIYILLWTTKHDTPFNSLEMGRLSFARRNCTFQNCYVTDIPDYFNDILEFDAILFNILGMFMNIKVPSKRSTTQNYILGSIEPAGIHKVPEKCNLFFNLTWTYRLDSDAVFPYIVIKDEHDQIIGPKLDMHWIDIKDMNETSDYVKNKLRKKRLAAIWFVSNCESSERLDFIKELQNELAQFDHRVDVYGNCGDKFCPTQNKDSFDECYALVESNYYFYMAFENSFSQDYVTEKILTGLEHFSVPVVFGGANYTRFMPEGTFLRAHTLGPAKLAKEMVDIINDRKKYTDMFRWHGHYSFHHTGENNYLHEICGLCAMLNNKTLVKRKKVYNTNLWWNEWYDGAPSDDGRIHLLLENETPKPGISGFVSNIYNYVFE